jgi:hypothetical protein
LYELHGSESVRKTRPNLEIRENQNADVPSEKRFGLIQRILYFFKKIFYYYTLYVEVSENRHKGGRQDLMKNLGNIMNQAKMMQNRLAQIQEEMGNKTVEASAGGGMVSVTANGRQEILAIKIVPEVVNPDDVEMLQDLVQAAVNDVLRKAQEMMAQEMAKVTGGIKIPGLF